MGGMRRWCGVGRAGGVGWEGVGRGVGWGGGGGWVGGCMGLLCKNEGLYM